MTRSSLKVSISQYVKVLWNPQDPQGYHSNQVSVYIYCTMFTISKKYESFYFTYMLY